MRKLNTPSQASPQVRPRRERALRRDWRSYVMRSRWIMQRIADLATAR
jgi:hypothetical protein